MIPHFYTHAHATVLSEAFVPLTLLLSYLVAMISNREISTLMEEVE